MLTKAAGAPRMVGHERADHQAGPGTCGEGQLCGPGGRHVQVTTATCFFVCIDFF